MTAFLHVASCTLVEIDRRFKGAYCLHHRGDNSPFKRRSVSTRLHGAIFKKTAIFIRFAVRT
jgi:hypothetical protein